MSTSSYLRGKFHEKLVNIQWKLNLYILICLKYFLEFEKISLVGESQNVGHFNFFRKIWNKSSTSWQIWLNKIPRSYIDGVKRPAKCQIRMSFHWLTIHRQSFSFGAPFWSHQEHSWPKKIRGPISVSLPLRTKFFCKNPPKGIVWTWLM
jgi:hypothetical protein